MKKFYFYLLMMAAAIAVGCTKDLTSDEDVYVNNVKTEFMQVEAALESPAARTILTDATGATASSSSSKYYTWYHQTPPYNCYADKESSIRLQLTTAHVTATSALI